MAKKKEEAKEVKEVKETKKKVSSKKTIPKKDAPKKEENNKVEKKIVKEELDKTTLFVTEEFRQQEEEEIKKKELEAKKKIKKEKRHEVFKEINAFIILVVSIGLIVTGVWYWYTRYYNKDDTGIKYEKEEKKINEYNTIKYSLMNDKDFLVVLNDKYLIETDKDDILYKIMDLKTNVLFEGEESFDYIYEGVDNKIYAFNESVMSDENIIELYVLEDEEFINIKTLSESNVMFNPIIYDNENGIEQLVGFTGLYTGISLELENITESVIYTIDDRTISISDIYVVGDSGLKEDKVISYDDEYIIIYEISNGEKKYGLYDLSSEKIIIEPQYEELHTNRINYIAKKDGLTGIISSKLKKIVDFQYDFIDKNDGFYVVSNNGKLGIMDEDYKMITDIIFDYQSSDSYLDYTYYTTVDRLNTFKAYKVDNKYILSINNGEDTGLNYNKHETYIIDSNGEYEVIVANKFEVNKDNSLIYGYNKQEKKYTIFNCELEKEFEISLEQFDYSSYPSIDLINENTLIIHLNSDIYFDYETGEEIDKQKDYQTLINGISISYNNKSKKVEYKVNNNIVASINVNIAEDSTYFKKISDNAIYYSTSKDYVYIEKGE